MAQCLKYFVKLDPNGAPILGSQMGFNPKVNQPTCAQTLGCSYVVLQNTAYTAPDGYVQCMFPDNKRYFFGIDKFGQIVPNSLISSFEYPNTPGRCNYYIEFKKFCVA